MKRKQLFSLVFLLFLCGGATAGQPRRELRDIPYVSGGTAEQRLDLYLPPGATAAPLVVWIHGGGWQSGNKSGCPAKGLLPYGFAAASVEYR